MTEKKFNWILPIVFMFILIISLSVVSAQQNTEQNLTSQNVKYNVTAYFFYGEGCPHCKQLEPILKAFEQKYPELNLIYVEVWQNPDNWDFFVNMSKAYGGNPKGVPTLFLGEDQPIIGYAKSKTDLQIEQRIKGCIVNGCRDPSEVLANYTAANKESSGMRLPIIILIGILILAVLFVSLFLILRKGGKEKKKRKEI